MRRIVKTTCLLGAIASAMATGVAAQDIVRENPFIGTWRCSGFGNQPAGILTIGNPMYEYTAVDANWTPVESNENGGGIMTFGAGTALPFGGPLLVLHSATGTFDENRAELMHWDGAEGYSMTCIEAVN